LMRLYYLNGDRAAALRQYEQCATILDEELGVKPSKRTIALYKQILTEQLVEPELITPLSTEVQLVPISIPIKAQPTSISISTETQPMSELLTPSLIESLSYLIQLQEFLNSLQNQVQQNIQKVEQVLNNNSKPPYSTNGDK
jgi:hypothetical protein